MPAPAEGPQRSLEGIRLESLLRSFVVHLPRYRFGMRLYCSAFRPLTHVQGGTIFIVQFMQFEFGWNAVQVRIFSQVLRGALVDDLTDWLLGWLPRPRSCYLSSVRSPWYVLSL